MSRPARPGGDPGRGKPATSHPDIHAHARGRIPESLIDAAIDGDLDPLAQREIAHALRYDPQRSAELRDTTDAINALRMPVPAPDLSHAILHRADRHRRFIPRAWRRHVRAGRVAMAACLLLALAGVAGLQRRFPRLTSVAAQPTPVCNIEQAVEQDRRQLAQAVTHEVRTLRASVEPVTGFFRRPGRADFHYEVSINTASLSGGQATALHDAAFSSAHPGMAVLYMLDDPADPLMPSHRPLGLISPAGAGGLAFAAWTDNLSRAPGRVPDQPAAPPRTAGLDVPDLP